MDILSFALGKKIGKSSVKLQEKTVTPSESEIVVTPDAAFDALSKVTVEAAQGGGGGTLPAGTYWEWMVGKHGSGNQSWFELNGELYRLFDVTSGRRFDKWNGTGWDAGADVITWTGAIGAVVHNGKAHFFSTTSSNNHAIFDGNTFTILKAGPKAQPIGVCSCGGKLYAHNYDGVTMHVWDEETDTWSVDGSPSVKYAVYALGSYNGVIYAVHDSTKAIYKYEGGAFVECSEFATTLPSDSPYLHGLVLRDDTGIYLADTAHTAGYSPINLYKVNFARGAWEFVEGLPGKMEQSPSLVFVKGELVYLVGVSGKAYIPLIRRVVTEE